MNLNIINSHLHPISSTEFRASCKAELDRNGVLLLPKFLTDSAIDEIRQEGLQNKHLAYYTSDTHNIYLSPNNSELPSDHPRNRPIESSKGCITDDQIGEDSNLKQLYANEDFRSFLCAVLAEDALYEYADNLSSVNLHYASEGQKLGWHFDNSSFAITLLIEKPKGGGEFEYVKNVRDADAGELNYQLAGKILEGEIKPKRLGMQPGSLVLFRGRNSMHRVTPTLGDRTRMLAVLAYNTEPNIALSESARMTFFGRLS